MTLVSFLNVFYTHHKALPVLSLPLKVLTRSDLSRSDIYGADFRCVNMRAPMCMSQVNPAPCCGKTMVVLMLIVILDLAVCRNAYKHLYSMSHPSLLAIILDFCLCCLQQCTLG